MRSELATILPFTFLGPAFKNNYLVKLFSFSFMPIHYHNTRFRFDVCRKMFSYKGLPNDC